MIWHMLLVIAVLASLLVMWVRTRNNGWALLIAFALYFLVKWDTWLPIKVVWWAMVGIALVLLALRSKWFQALAAWGILTLTLLMVSLGAFWHFVSTPHLHNVSATTSATAQDLTVTMGDLVPAAKCTSDEFNDNSLSTKRLWSDSVSTPFASSDKDAMLTELLAENCQNPVLGDAYAQALNDAVIGDFKVGPANPWLGEFLAKATSPGLRSAYLTKKAGHGDEVYVTKEYQQKAELINVLLLKLVNQGVVEGKTSTVNWPLQAMVGDELPRAFKVTDPKKQENLPFLALAYTTKAGTGECATYVLGVNVKDKRPENFGCAVTTQVAPKHPKTPPPTHTPTPTPTPTSTPSPNCPFGVTPEGHCKKDPNPSGYVYPSGKPSATVTGPASAPSPVATQSDPAATATVTAPGATPEPSRSTPSPTESAVPSGTQSGCVNPPGVTNAC